MCNAPTVHNYFGSSWSHGEMENNLTQNKYRRNYSLGLYIFRRQFWALNDGRTTLSLFIVLSNF